MFKVKNKDTKRLYWRLSSVLIYVTFFSSVFIVVEDHVSVCWDLIEVLDCIFWSHDLIDRSSWSHFLYTLDERFPCASVFHICFDFIYRGISVIHDLIHVGLLGLLLLFVPCIGGQKRTSRSTSSFSSHLWAPNFGIFDCVRCQLILVHHCIALLYCTAL